MHRPIELVAMPVELEPSTNLSYSYMFALRIVIFLSHCYDIRIVVIIMLSMFFSFLSILQSDVSRNIC